MPGRPPLAPAASGRASVTSARAVNAIPRPPRPHSAFPRLPEPEPQSAFVRTPFLKPPVSRMLIELLCPAGHAGPQLPHYGGLSLRTASNVGWLCTGDLPHQRYTASNPSFEVLAPSEGRRAGGRCPHA